MYSREPAYRLSVLGDLEQRGEDNEGFSFRQAAV